VGRRTLLAALVLLCAGLAVCGFARADASPRCAQTAQDPTPPAPKPGSPCWVEADPYPFGSDGNPVDVDTTACKVTEFGVHADCYLTVTSFAFRAWNRGLAATADLQSSSPNTTAFGAWLYNGVRWFPDPTFPGKRICAGTKILWAGKRDYWLVGQGLDSSWPRLCRFDGVKFEWDPLPVPTETLARVTDPNTGRLLPGGITTGACFAWNNCTFFGTYGTAVTWDGKLLEDASPPPSLPWLWTAYTDSAARVGDGGDLLGVAVGGTASYTTGPPLPAQPDGSAPPQLYTSGGASFVPVPFAVPTIPQPDDPFRTDVVGVDLDQFGNGWLAGNPAAMRRFDSPIPPPDKRRTPTTPEPSPLVPITALGANPDCQGPPKDRFMFTRNPTSDDAYLWSGISVVSGTGEAFASGQFRPGLPHAEHQTARNDDGQPEPSLVDVACSVAPKLTTFRVPDPTERNPRPLVPADRGGAMTSVAANAVNDGWAASTRGLLVRRDSLQYAEPPRVYHFLDTAPPQAPAGDDVEDRPLDLQEDPPIIVFEPLPPPPTPPAETVTTTTTTTTKSTLPPAVDHVKAKLVKLRLYLEFQVHRPVELGAVGLKTERVVATTGLRSFGVGRGRLVLTLSPKRWPRQIRFITDTPYAELYDPGKLLRKRATLRALSFGTGGRKVVSVAFQLSPPGADDWTTIAVDRKAPYAIAFDTTSVPNGPYQLRALATDNKGTVGASNPLTRRVAN